MIRGSLARWAEDWDSPEDAVYDSYVIHSPETNGERPMTTSEGDSPVTPIEAVGDYLRAASHGDTIQVSYSCTYIGTHPTGHSVRDDRGYYHAIPADATMEVIAARVYANSPTRKIEPGDIIRTSTGVVCVRTHQEEWYRLDSMTRLNLTPGVIRNATLLIRHREVVT